MLAPEEKLKLATKPYLTTTARFANGADTPRDFLERCLADLVALEPRIGAFVHLNLERARVRPPPFSAPPIWLPVSPTACRSESRAACCDREFTGCPAMSGRIRQQHRRPWPTKMPASAPTIWTRSNYTTPWRAIGG